MDLGSISDWRPVKSQRQRSSHERERSGKHLKFNIRQKTSDFFIFSSAEFYRKSDVPVWENKTENVHAMTF